MIYYYHLEDHDVHCRLIAYCDVAACSGADSGGVVVHSGGSLTDMQAAAEVSRHANCRAEIEFPLHRYAGVWDGQHRFPRTGETVTVSVPVAAIPLLLEICRLDHRVGNHLVNAVASSGKYIRMTSGDDADVVNLHAIAMYRTIVPLVTIKPQ